MKALLDRAGPLGDRLAAGPYDAPALVPASPWLDAEPPAAPLVEVTPRGGALDVAFRAVGADPARHYVVRARRAGAWEWHLVPDGVGTYVPPRRGGPGRGRRRLGRGPHGQRGARPRLVEVE